MSGASAVAPAHAVFPELRAGDRIEVTHEVKVGSRRWTSVTVGTVESKERRRHGLHNRRAGDDKVFSDVVLLVRDDGERVTVTLDEFTTIRRLP